MQLAIRFFLPINLLLCDITIQLIKVSRKETTVLDDEENNKSIEFVWDKYNKSIQELEGFEHRADQKKKEIIINIRDCVVSLVQSQKITIPEKEIANYVYGKLHERHIKYSKSHFYNLFDENLKRKYTHSAVGHNDDGTNNTTTTTHQHTWITVTNHGQFGTWESCDCGANKINGVEHVAVPVLADKLESKIPKSVPESEEPKTIEFEILDLFLEISQNNVKAIKMLKRKCIFHKSQLEKEVTKRISVEKQKRFDDTKKQIQQRVDAITSQLQDKFGSNLNKVYKELQSVITMQHYMFRYFNNRTSLYTWEKAMGRFACTIGYDKNEIAKFLYITTKHMKVSVLKEGTSSNSQVSLLKDVEWFSRCPNPDCGIVLKEYFEDKMNEWKQGKFISGPQDYELDFLMATGYQAEVLELKKRLNKKLTKKLHDNS